MRPAQLPPPSPAVGRRAGADAGAALYRAVFAASPLGMAIVAAGAEGNAVITEANEAMTTVLRCRTDQLVDRPLHELLGHEPVILDVAWPTALAVERPMMLADGREIWTRWHLTDLPSEPGRPATALAQVEDVTEQHAAADRARRRLRLLELIPEPVIIRSLDGTIQYWNGGAAEVYGYRSAQVIGRQTHDLLATDWGAATLDDVERNLASHGAWFGRLQHRHADGRTLHMSSRQLRDDNVDGEPVILEINIDISERVAAERALAASEAKFRSQFAHSTVGQFIRRPDGIIEDANPALAAMLGYPLTELIGLHADQLFSPTVASARRNSVHALLSGERAAVQGDGVLVRADGSLLDVEMNISVARDGDGRVTHLIGIFQDISDRKAAEEALRHRASHDALTGLANRGLLEGRLHAALLEAASEGRVGLLMIDLDGFKEVNDRHGHATGDDLLREVADRLTTAVRGVDTVARLGGDEFVVLCPALSDRSDLGRVASRLNTELARPYRLGGKVVHHVSASIGMAFPHPSVSVDDALQQADRAMYAVKASGKNNVGMFATPA